MVDEIYLNSLRDELSNLYDQYDDRYIQLCQEADCKISERKYFSGSSELLCIYEPSLTNKLRCNWCLKGSFKAKKPRSKQYHILSFDNGKIIKIDFFDDVSNLYQNHKEVFIVYEHGKTIYLVFDTTNKSHTPKLGEIYLLKYDELLRLTEYVHIPSKALSKDLTGEIYKYNNHNLIESIKYSTWYSEIEKYEYEYGENGYMNCYKRYALKSSNPNIYTAKFTPKDIECFEKWNRFYFSPSNK